MSSWIEIKATLATVPDDWAPMIEVFRDEDIEGTVQTERPPTLSGYIGDDSTNREKADRLRGSLVEAGAIAVEINTIAEVDWAEAWKQFFKPRRVGKRFVVRPSWEPFESSPDDLLIVLDPGQAFGTGDHPTTRMMLEILEPVIKKGDSVADIGCGSGILSVGAMLLGASEVIAVDVDAVAVRATLDNAERNDIAITGIVGTGFQEIEHGKTFDVVLSNIISAALIRLAPDAFQRTAGSWIVSGIIEPNWPDVRAAAEKAGFNYAEHQQEGDWIAARFTR